MAKHKQVGVKYKEIEEDIDALIVPLILEIWKAGIETLMSCQNSMNKIWIDFPDVHEAE